ncbi:MAG: NUDIX hydrolase [Puniceicoccales bacterium]|jgi:8-oxo-dGTP pyrophosphatase MutT (NUDIX family)|nr:NUDIX hydrolase [Puniceicoccales bacterium]
MNSKVPSRWQLNSEVKHFSCPIFNIYERKYKHPIDHRCGNFYILKTVDWVQVIALTLSGKLIMVEQFRFGTEMLSLETPGGLMEKGENAVVAGIRELKEETGYAGREGRCIGVMYPNPALQNNRLHIIMVEGCEKIEEQDLDENEEIRCLELNFEECLEKIKKGEIMHGLAIAALFSYQLIRAPRPYDPRQEHCFLDLETALDHVQCTCFQGKHNSWLQIISSQNNIL